MTSLISLKEDYQISTIRTLIGDEEGQTISTGTASELAKKEEIYESHVVDFFKDKYKTLGYSEIEGPYTKGPDFYGIPEGKKRKVPIEIETHSHHYFKHKHHLDSDFNNAHLICLYFQEPTKQNKPYTPKHVKVIDNKSFYHWWKVARKKEITDTKKLILGHIVRGFFLNLCSDRSRSMATCPFCNLCPYPDQGLEYHFDLIAMKYLAEDPHKYECNLGTWAPSIRTKNNYARLAAIYKDTMIEAALHDEETFS